MAPKPTCRSPRASELRPSVAVQLLARRRDQARDYAVAHPEFARSLPRVDLLPQRMRDEIAIRRIRSRAIVLGACTVLVLGAVWLLQGAVVASASGELAAARAENARITGQVKALTPVRLMADQIAAQEGLVTTALASTPQSQEVLRVLQAAAGPDVRFSDIAVAYQGIPDAAAAQEPRTELNPCPSPDPFTVRVAIGCVRFTGVAPDRATLSTFLGNADRQPMLFGAYVDSSNIATDAGSQAVAFTGTVAVSTDALADPLTSEQLDALIAGQVEGGAQ